MVKFRLVIRVSYEGSLGLVREAILNHKRSFLDNALAMRREGASKPVQSFYKAAMDKHDYKDRFKGVGLIKRVKSACPTQSNVPSTASIDTTSTTAPNYSFSSDPKLPKVLFFFSL